MSVWIKICGLKTPDAIEAARDADAIGFVFAPSPRQVTPDEDKALAQVGPSTIARVAVTRRPDQKLIDDIVAIFKPDLLQLDIEDIAALTLPTELALLPVHRNAKSEALAPMILFEGPRSGAGERADWSAAAEMAARTQVVLAGGLDPNNVAEAIAAVRPFGVDVSSGVESAPGVKDPARIAHFIQNARQARAITGLEAHAG